MLAASDADAEEERVGTEMSRSSSQVRFRFRFGRGEKGHLYAIVRHDREGVGRSCFFCTAEGRNVRINSGGQWYVVL